jgi:uncharacterized protein DUF4431
VPVQRMIPQIAIATCLVLFLACRNQSAGRATVDTALVFVSSEATDSCLRSEPDTVTLGGQLRVDTFPGRPNYQSIKEGDEAEPEYVLHLDRKVCVSATGQSLGKSTEFGVDSVQIITADPTVERATLPLVGHHVTVAGTLFAAETGHHHTRVLITAKSVRAA